MGIFVFAHYGLFRLKLGNRGSPRLVIGAVSPVFFYKTAK